MLDKTKKSNVPTSLAAIVADLRRQPKPPARMVDILAYAVVKTSHPLRRAQQSKEQRTERRNHLLHEYRQALAASKANASPPLASDQPPADKADNEYRNQALMETLLLAKIAYTLEALDIPASGNLETDIFNIGMNCIGNLDYRYPAEKNLQNGRDHRTPDDISENQTVAIAKFFNMVLYDLKTEELLRHEHPELDDDRAVIILAETYQSLFKKHIVRSKDEDGKTKSRQTVYRFVSGILSDNVDGNFYPDCFELVEQQLSLMTRSPTQIQKLVETGNAMLNQDAQITPYKTGPLTSLFRFMMTKG
jgi:hypothetical protein